MMYENHKYKIVVKCMIVKATNRVFKIALARHYQNHYDSKFNSPIWDTVRDSTAMYRV